MLVPFMIFLMILSPVLIPAAVTIVNVMQGNHRPAGTVGLSRSFAAAASPSQPPPNIRPTPVGPHPPGCGPTGLWGIRLQNRGAVPVTSKQRQFDVEPVAADFPATARQRRDPLDTSPS